MALFDIIKKNKQDENIVWRHPKTNFNTGAQLIVDESQEALFYSMGKALDLFPAGKYTLSTNNIPLLRSIINIPTGFRTPFTCQVYFIDVSEKKSRWGTSSKIQFLEPKYNFPIEIGACGEFRFKIKDSRKLILKLVGIKKDFDATDIDEFFSSQILLKVKNYIANIIKEEKISIFEIDSYLENMSNSIKEKLINDFDEYGIELNDFFITTIAKPDEDKQYLMFKELYFKQGVGVATAESERQIELIKTKTEADKRIIESEAEAIKRKQEGYSYQEEKQFEIGKQLAGNDAVGQFTNMGIGLGMMSGVSAPLGDKVSQQVTGAFATVSPNVCSNCNFTSDGGSLFCSQCGNSLLAKKTCEACGNELAANALFCSRCGKGV